jgi:pSer/pThr/pTyr-binding forkhead associated (FHA) protein/S1-C subfamily serine protease
MSYLKLVETATGRSVEFRSDRVRIGRDPGCDVVCDAPTASVVSSRHCDVRMVDDAWRVVDLASRNGTFVNGTRVSADTPVAPGDEISLGATGPRFVVSATSEVAPTEPEVPSLSIEAPPRPYAVSLLDPTTGRRYEARGTRIRIGRGRVCEVQIPAVPDAVVSRVHAELLVTPAGSLVVRDAGSTNGTWVNDARVHEPMPVRLGDRLTLGPGGPVLVVEALGTARDRPVSAARGALARARRSSAYLRALAVELGGASRRRGRWLTVLALVIAASLAGAVYGVYWLLSGEVRDTEQRAETAADSARAREAALAQALAAARAAAAPSLEVDSLRVALESAQVRTAALSTAFARAQTALADQIAAGETRRLGAQAELDRLRAELAAAEQRAPSPGLVDSLRQAIAGAEAQTANVAAKLRAVRGTDFAAIAERNQNAIGLVTVALAHRYYSGTGFVISTAGYLLTNWHVVADSGGLQADTIWVTMADHGDAEYADVVASSEATDLALLKIRAYRGPYLQALDWTATQARQGDPAALIGFPAGSGFARVGSATAVVRTSMTAGIISRVTDEMIQFDGITIGGSSGSPLFNASGQVVAVHRAGLVQSPGFAFSVPLRLAVALLPPALKVRFALP